MAHGREDFTYLADTDIIAQTIGNIAIDIAAQTIAELAIKTTGATQLAIDIAAQTLSALGINITAQSLAELVIKINAQAVGIYLQPEWAALQGYDIAYVGTGTPASGTRTLLLNQLIPAGKKFYCSQWGFAVTANTGIYGELDRYDGAAEYNIMIMGGQVGFGVGFPTPAVIPAGQYVRIYVVQYSGAAATTNVSAVGYLL